MIKLLVVLAKERAWPPTIRINSAQRVAVIWTWQRIRERRIFMQKTARDVAIKSSNTLVLEIRLCIIIYSGVYSETMCLCVTKVFLTLHLLSTVIATWNAFNFDFRNLCLQPVSIIFIGLVVYWACFLAYWWPLYFVAITELIALRLSTCHEIHRFQTAPVSGQIQFTPV